MKWHAHKNYQIHKTLGTHTCPLFTIFLKMCAGSSPAPLPPTNTHKWSMQITSFIFKCEVSYSLGNEVVPSMVEKKAKKKNFGECKVEVVSEIETQGHNYCYRKLDK